MIGKSKNKTPPAEPPREDQQEDAAQARVEQLEKDMLYLHAEIDNLKKRMVRDRSEAARHESERLWKTVFPIYLNLKRAMAAYDEHTTRPEQVCEGIHMILKEFEGAFSRAALEVICALDCVFDPNIHEALFTEERPDLKEKTVVEEVEPGFVLNGRLVKPAKVKVGIPVQPSRADSKSDKESNDTKSTDENTEDATSSETGGSSSCQK